MSRLLFLSADPPEWFLAEYQPIDEFAYVIPGFNLVHHGSWTHQAASWTVPEGTPFNGLQNLLTAATLTVFGQNYWGFRLSSVIFGLVAFVAILGTIHRQSADLVRSGIASRAMANVVVAVAGVLLLVDFGSLMGARIVEPTIARLAVMAVLLLLIARGTFLGERTGVARTVVLGAYTSGAVFLVYIYNVFMVPAVLAGVVWWAWRHGRSRAVIRHTLALGVGGLGVAAAYFAIVAVGYGKSPLGWYETWITPLATTNRGQGLSPSKALSVMDANLFRLDPALLALSLISVPVLIWSFRRRPTALVLVYGTLFAFLVAQSLFVADYPERKFLVMTCLAVPVAARGVLELPQFLEWLDGRKLRRVAGSLILLALLAVVVAEMPVDNLPPSMDLLTTLIVVTGWTSVGVLAALVLVRRRKVLVAGGFVLVLAMLAPIAYADLAYVYRHPTFTYRDTLIAAKPEIDGKVIAGSLSFGMQLYNTSRPVLSGYVTGMTREEYYADLERMFVEGRATALFGYTDADTQAEFGALGLSLVEEYDIVLPRKRVLGRYVYDPSSAVVR